jgi:hypothetical protein
MLCDSHMGVSAPVNGSGYNVRNCDPRRRAGTPMVGVSNPDSERMTKYVCERRSRDVDSAT